MKKTTKLAALLLVLMMVAGSAFAASPWTQESTYGDQVKAKLDFGLKNLLGGWTQLLTQPLDAIKGDENLINATGIGIYNAIVYTFGGVIQTGTFFLPQIDVPIPEDGVDF